MASAVAPKTVDEAAAPAAAWRAPFEAQLEQQLTERREARVGRRWLALGWLGLLGWLALAGWAWATRDAVGAPVEAGLQEAALALADRAPELTDEDVRDEDGNSATDEVIREVDGEIAIGAEAVASWQLEVRADDAAGVSDEMLAAFHAMRQVPRNVSLLPRTTHGEYNVMQPGVQYLLYSPSGGWGNQLMCLANAVMLARMSGKTLVVPMHGKHSNLYRGFLKLQQNELVPMDQVIDFEHVRGRTHVKFLFLNVTISDWLHRYTTRSNSVYHSLPGEGLMHAKDPGVYSRVKRSCRKNKQLVYLKGRFFTARWLDKAALHSARTAPYLQDLAAAIADAMRTGVFGMLQKEPKHPQPELPASSSSNSKTATTTAAATSAGRFNAMHIRLGDYSSRAGKDAAFFLKNAQQYGFAKDVPLYVAAEEPRNHSYFKPLIEYFDTVVFFQDVLQVKELHMHLVDFVLRTPTSKVRDSVAGMMEQLICAHADRFLGTKISTWSMDVRRKRADVKDAVPQLWASIEAEKQRTGVSPSRWSGLMGWRKGVEFISSKN
jgi:hypothetical protein